MLRDILWPPERRFKTKRAEIEALRKQLWQVREWVRAFDRRERRYSKLSEAHRHLRAIFQERVSERAERLADRILEKQQSESLDMAMAILDWMETGRFNGKPIQDMALLRMELE